jgi:ribosomal protein S18 acetylase RimI-like enzyme
VVPTIQFQRNLSSEDDIFKHLSRCRNEFIPPLDERVNLNDYSRKLATNAMRFEAWAAEVLIGLVAAYLDTSSNKTIFITNVSLLPGYQRKGIATFLLSQCLTFSQENEVSKVTLEVNGQNANAVALYRKLGFVTDSQHDHSLFMTYNIAPSSLI